MQLNKVYSVKTIDRVAAELGETVDRIFDLAIDMETEDGVIRVYGPGDDSVIAFTPFGSGSKTGKSSLRWTLSTRADLAAAYAGCLPSKLALHSSSDVAFARISRSRTGHAVGSAAANISGWTLKISANRVRTGL